jgi:hypothetical protein
MAMHANRLVGTIFNPFRLIAMLLGGVVIILSALLAWQWPRAAILEKKLKASEERHRVAVDRSWQWKTRADAASAALVQTEKKLAEDGATRAKEAERSVQLAKSAERRAASLDRRRKERINDALRIAAGNDDLPLDLDSRLRDLASSGASANRLDDASASSGNSASGMSVGPGDASPIQPDAPPATSSGDGQDGSGSGLLAGSRTPR